MLKTHIKKTILTGLSALILGFNGCGSPPIAQMPDGNYKEDAGIEQLFDGGDLEDGGSEYDGGISDDGGLDYDAGIPEDGRVSYDGGQNRDGGLRSDGGPDAGYVSDDGGLNVADGGSDAGYVFNDGGSDAGIPIADGGLAADGGQAPDGGADAGICFDPNNNTFNTASIITEGTYTDYQICSGTQDWFKTYVPVGKDLEARIGFTHANGGLNLQLYDSTNSLITSSEGLGDSETVTSPGAGSNLYIRIFGQSGVQNTYSLTVTLTPKADAGLPTDAGIPADGGLVADGGPVADGGLLSDGGSVADGGAFPDGGQVPADGGSLYDGGAIADGGTIMGEEGGSCYPNHTCNEDLSCYSNLCVRVPILDGGPLSDGGAIADGGSVIGEEGSPCYPNHTCNEGLSCYSNLCVRVPSGDGGIASDGGLILDAGILEDAGIVTPYTPDNNCIALFHFNNSINNDCMAVYNSIQNIGGQSQYREGKFGSAIYFDGDYYLRGLGNITLDIVNALTVEAWIKPEKTENSYKGAFGNIFHTTSSGIDSNNPGYYGFVLWVTNGRVNFTAGIEGQMYYLSAEAQLPTDRFTHIAATYDRGVAQIYVNRHLAIEGNTNGNLSRIPNSYVQFTMGADANNWNAFIGAIDELRISSIAREF